MRSTRVNAVIIRSLVPGLVLFCAVLAKAQAPSASGGALTPEQKLDLAIRKIDAQDLRESERLINEVAVEKPTLERLRLARGLYFAALPGRGAEAVSELETYNATPEARSEYRGFAAIGDIYIKSRMYSSAVLPLERARGIAPLKENGKSIRSAVLMNLAMANVGLQNNKAAVKIAKEAQAAAPDDPDVHRRLAEIAATANDYETSVSAVDQAILLYKNDIRDDPFNRSSHEKLKQCYSVATSLYDYQRRADPENSEPYFRSARVLLQAAETDHRIAMIDALTILQQAIERAPKNNDLKLMAVEIEYSLGGTRDARDLLEKVLDSDAKNEKARQLKEKFEKSPPRPNLS